MTRKANVPEDMVILRDRWYDKHNDFGVKFFDSPSSSGTPVTYKLQVYQYDPGSVPGFFLNRPGLLDNLSKIVGTISSITAYEVTE